MQIEPTSPAISPTLPQVTSAVPTADPAPAPASEPALPAEPPSKFLQKLASGHFNAVAGLRHRMRLADEIAASNLKLPEPAAPRGNGKAYTKFLAAYRASQPGAAPQPTQPSPQSTPSAVVDPALQSGGVDSIA